ncbi:diaminopimelate epimerase [Nocardioides sp.]|uniref:diaminopimelate epimerase n=1 Tax=Nocardioides sp. TaxID=35761 RepID=UPI002D7ECA39|nr:diaminopimelate epimerase [Nocardioides sp.]HET8959028.1 diaminopimelate epimerase [Nocardioides sp.]
MPPTYPFLKGHGTQNDFVLLPDHDGSVHGDLPAERVAALCDRRAGIGGDGVLRVIRTSVADPSQAEDAEWFMDYRNADGSLSEMCGNGIRLFARHLVDEGLVDARGPIPIATRDGLKLLRVEAASITADLGSPKVLGETMVAIGDRSWPARHVDMGNPHAVVFVDDLSEAGPLLESPVHDTAVYPTGVNVEFVVRRGERHVGMRVHERGSGETRSCGTGACAAMVATAVADGRTPDEDLSYRVDLPGGTLTVTWSAGDEVLLTGPAVVVARGTTAL